MATYWTNSVYCSGLHEPISLDAYLAPAGLDETDNPRVPQIPDGEPSALDEVERRQHRAMVHRFVASLPPRTHEAILRIFWLGESQAEVAKRFGVTRMAVCKMIKKVSEAGRVSLATLSDSALLN